MRWTGGAFVSLVVLVALGGPAAATADAAPAGLATAPEPAVFCDVDATSWFTEAVAWAASVGVVAGVDERRFDPEAPTTRGQIVTFLHRFVGWRDGEPPAGSHAFVDVPRGAFFDEAVGWAVEAGITDGRTATTFAPELPTTREEFAGFVHRLHDAPTEWPVTPVFADIGNSWFARQISWLHDQGLTDGTSATTFSPERTITRAELVSFLWRMAGRPDAPHVPAPSRCPRTFTVVGDSVLLRAVQLGHLTPGSFAGFTGAVDVVGCRQPLLEGIGCGWSTPIPSAWRVLATANLAGTLGDIVVVHTGTNGDLDAATFDLLVEAAAPALEVWFVTVKTRWYDGAATNAAIVDGVARWQDRRSIGLLDWHALSGSQPGLLAGDGIHLTTAGSRAFTDLIASVMR